MKKQSRSYYSYIIFTVIILQGLTHFHILPIDLSNILLNLCLVLFGIISIVEAYAAQKRGFVIRKPFLYMGIFLLLYGLVNMILSLPH